MYYRQPTYCVYCRQTVRGREHNDLADNTISTLSGISKEFKLDQRSRQKPYLVDMQDQT